MAEKLRSWENVAADPGYQQLPDEEKQLVQRQWFEQKWKTLGIQEQPKAYGRTQKDVAWDQFQSTLRGKPSESEPFLVTHAPDIGGAAGAIAGIPAGGFSSIPFAAGGGMIGEFIKQAWRKEYSPATAAKGPEEVLGSAIGAAGTQASGEAAGQLINLGASKMVSPIRRALEPKEGAPEAQNLLQSKGGSLTVGQASTGMQGLESLAREGVFSNRFFNRLDVKNQLAIRQARNDLLGDLTNIPQDQITSQSGDLYQKAIASAEQAHKNLSSKLYADLDSAIANDPYFRSRLAQGVKIVPRQDVVDMRPAKAQVYKDVQDYMARGTSPPAPLTDFLNTPDRLTFQQAFDKRSDMLAALRDAKGATTERAQSNAIEYNKLQARVLDASDTAAKRLPSNIYDKYRAASDFYREGKQVFEDDVIVRLAKQNPEQVADSLFRPGNETQIVRAKEALQKAAQYDRSIDVRDTWGNMQAAWLTKQIESRGAIDAETGVKGEAMWKAMNSDKDRRTFQAVFSPSEQARIKTFFDAMDLSQRDPSRSGRIGLFLQGSALAGLAWNIGSQFSESTSPYSGGGPGTVASLAVLLTPEVIARIMTRPGLVNAATKAMQLGNTPAGVQAQKALLPALLEAGGQVVRAGRDAAGKVILNQAVPTTMRSFVVPQAEDKIKEMMQ